MILLRELSETLQNDLAALNLVHRAVICREVSALAAPAKHTHGGRAILRAPSLKPLSHNTAVSPSCSIRRFISPEEAETHMLGVGYKQIVPSDRRFLDTRYHHLVSGAPWEPAASADEAVSR